MHGDYNRILIEIHTYSYIKVLKIDMNKIVVK